MVVEITRNFGILNALSVNFTLIGLVTGYDILVVNGLFASFFGSGRASDLYGLVVPDRRAGIDMFAVVFDGKDVAFLVTGVVRGTASIDGHIVIIRGSLVVE